MEQGKKNKKIHFPRTSLSWLSGVNVPMKLSQPSYKKAFIAETDSATREEKMKHIVLNSEPSLLQR